MNQASSKITLFLKRYGYVINSNKNALSLSFKFRGVKYYALAVRQVCYVDEFQSEDVYNDFYPGDRVNFDAVLDPETPLFDVCKVSTLWTKIKPIENSTINDWYTNIASLYDNCERYKSLLIDGPYENQFMESSCSYSCETTKKLTSERKAVIFLSNVLKEEMKNNNIFSTNDSDLHILLTHAKNHVKHYLNNTYPSLVEFFKYHSEIFKISSFNEQIFPPKHFSVVQNYVYDDLPEKLKGNDYKEQRDSSMIVVPPSFDLEIDCNCVWYFSNIIKKIKQTERFLFSTRSKHLEDLLEEAPKNLRSHIQAFYVTLGEFIHYHDDIFHVNESRKIFPGSTIYIKNRIKSKMSGNSSVTADDKYNDYESELNLNENFDGGKENDWKHYGKIQSILETPEPKVKSTIYKVTREMQPYSQVTVIRGDFVGDQNESKDLVNPSFDQKVETCLLDSLFEGNFLDLNTETCTEYQYPDSNEQSSKCETRDQNRSYSSSSDPSPSASRLSNTKNRIGKALETPRSVRCRNNVQDEIYFSDDEANGYSSTSWIPLHRMDENELKAQLTRLLNHFNLEVKEKSKDLKESGIQTLSTGPVFSMCQCDEDLLL